MRETVSLSSGRCIASMSACCIDIAGRSSVQCLGPEAYAGLVAMGTLP
jgi:hypothetical protein